MKKTLEGMSGGSLVNIEEAADGGEGAKNMYFKQESLMNSLFGLDKDSAARTIEMLQKLDDTTVMGNKDLKDELGKNIEDQLKNQDKNMGYQERIAASTENMFASSILTNEILMKIVDTSNAGASSIADKQFGINSAAYDNTFDAATSMAKTANDLVDRSEEKLLEMANQISGVSSLTGKGLKKQQGDDVMSKQASTIKGDDGSFIPFDFSNQVSKGEESIVGAIEALKAVILNGDSENLTYVGQ